MLAGGRGTRLAGVVHDRPKPLAPVAGRPFLAWQLDELVDQGIVRIVLSVGHRAAQVVACFGRAHGQATIEYVHEASPLGTGGAVRAALARVDGPGAFVVNGDTLAPVSLPRLAGRTGERLVVSVCPVDDGARYGVVDVVDGTITGFRARGDPGPALVNAGAYWMAQDLLVDTPAGTPFSLEHDFLAPRAASLRARAERLAGSFIDIGTPHDYLAAQTAIPRLVAQQRCSRR